MYYLYLLNCSDNSLYTGIASNLAKRMQMHKSGKGSKYVNSRLPFQLIYIEKFATKSAALKRELEIKSWKRAEKLNKLHLSTKSLGLKR